MSQTGVVISAFVLGIAVLLAALVVVIMARSLEKRDAGAGHSAVADVPASGASLKALLTKHVFTSEADKKEITADEDGSGKDRPDATGIKGFLTFLAVTGLAAYVFKLFGDVAGPVFNGN